MEISWNIQVFTLSPEKERENTRSHIGSRAKRLSYTRERLQSPSVYFTAEFVWSI